MAEQKVVVNLATGLEDPEFHCVRGYFVRHGDQSLGAGFG